MDSETYIKCSGYNCGLKLPVEDAGYDSIMLQSLYETQEGVVINCRSCGTSNRIEVVDLIKKGRKNKIDHLLNEK